MGKLTKTSFRSVITLTTKDKIVEELSKGANRKLIACNYQVSQSFITIVKQEMPLFCYSNKEASDA